MDIQSLYEDIQIRFGLSSRIKLEEFRAPSPPIAGFGDVSVFGERSINALIERQDRDTVVESSGAPITIRSIDLEEVA